MLLLNRNQAIRIFKRSFSGRQFDYICNKFGITPQKVGIVSIFTYEQLLKARICFSLYREIKLNEKTVNKLLKIMPNLQYEQWKKMLLSSSQMKNFNDKEEFLVSDVIFDKETQSEYWLINYDDYQLIHNKILDNFTEMAYVTIVGVYVDSKRELDIGLKKENLLSEIC